MNIVRLLACVVLAFSVSASADSSPRIRSFAPRQGTPGTVVVIRGTKLGKIRSVLFGGVQAQLLSRGRSKASAVVPPAARTGYIRLRLRSSSARSKRRFVVQNSATSGPDGPSASTPLPGSTPCGDQCEPGSQQHQPSLSPTASGTQAPTLPRVTATAERSTIPEGTETPPPTMPSEPTMTPTSAVPTPTPSPGSTSQPSATATPTPESLGSIRGSVVRSGGAGKLSGITIQARQGGRAAEGVTDESGNFVINRLQPGSWTLSAGSEGCGTAFRPFSNQGSSSNTVTVQSGASASLDFEFFTEPDKSLLIRDLSVVNDLRDGLSFGSVVTRMTPAGVNPADFVEAWFTLYLTPQEANGFPVPPRPAFQYLLDEWPRTADGRLDLAQSPFRLLAVINRIDLRDSPSAPSVGFAGEGRFVFGLARSPFGVLRPGFTISLEFGLPLTEEIPTPRAWARLWNNLSTKSFGADYTAALLDVISRFTDQNTGYRVRTNEIEFGFPWEMREFVLDSATGLLRQIPLDQTPHQGFNRGAPESDTPAQVLADWLEQNRDAVLSGTHRIPRAFLAASVLNDNIDRDTTWTVGGLVDEPLRHAFAKETCNGCHLGETDAFFQHVKPRIEEEVAEVSGFLQGEVQNREQKLLGLVCP